MKIALSIENFSASKGGGEGYANNLALQLIKNGHEVHVFSNSFGGQSGHIIPHKVPIIRFPKALRILSFAINSERILSQNDFDLIIGFGGTSPIDVYRPGGGTEMGWFLQNLNSIDNKLVRFLNKMIRRISPTNLAGFYVDHKIYKNNKLRFVIANSHMVKKDITKYYNFPADKIKVIYNGVDLNRFNPANKNIFRKEIRRTYGIDDRAVMLLFIANNFRLKGLYPLIKAIAILKTKVREPFRLIVAGRGKRQKFIRLIRKVGCEENIIFTGQIKEIERLYAGADIFVHPTFYDPFANVCLEALASGIPVITTRHNGAGELITEGVEGFVVNDPTEIDTLAERIAFFFDETERIKAGENARLLSEQFPWERNYSEIFKAIAEINE